MLPSEQAGDPEDGRITELTASDGKVLARVLRRIQREGDLPSFLNNMAEITQKSDANSRFSAGQLSEALLKDYALTAKLLRVVNMNYVNTFGGKVFSVNQAVVILGFDSVRTVALGVSVYKMPGSSGSSRHKSVGVQFRDQIAESAVNSLISGELARFLAPEAGLKKQTELAMMCAMFRNLGHHLVMQYLPTDYQAILDLEQRTGCSKQSAAQKVLGASFQTLSVGVAEHWKLPKPIRVAMAQNPEPNSKLLHEEERLNALAKFATDLCEIVATGNRNTWTKSLERLMARNQNLLNMNEKEVGSLLGLVCKSFEDRYSALFGPHSKKSRFLNNARTMAGTEAPNHGAQQEPLTDKEGARASESAEKLAQHFAQKRDPNELLSTAMKELSLVLRPRRIVLLSPSRDRKRLLAKAAEGSDVEGLVGEFEFALARGADTFVNAIRGGKAVVVSDTLTPSATRSVPQRYYELIGSPAFALYPCISMGYPTSLLLVDADYAESLPGEDRVAASKQLRELVAKFASYDF